ncbi:MAG: hypothetical protein ACI9DS_002272 [Glaciecola sp.]|jgi:hypothetical protein
MPYARIRGFKYTFIFITFLLSGCANQPTVYIYAKYLDDHQKKEIQNKLKSEKYQVELNEFDFPTTITENTIIYSLLLREPEVIDKAIELAAEAGLLVKRTQGLTEGNHWYTKNSIALFLLPKNKDRKYGLFRQDLINDYKGENCGNEITLSLKKYGSFKLVAASDGESKRQLEEGKWNYRQHPFIELQKNESSYADYYFEITQYKGRDKVSEIEFIKLKLLNSGSLPEECSFLHGMRI